MKKIMMRWKINGLKIKKAKLEKDIAEKSKDEENDEEI